MRELGARGRPSSPRPALPSDARQSANLEVPITAGYFVHLIAYIIINDLNNARFLWKRIPADTKKVRGLRAGSVTLTSTGHARARSAVARRPGAVEP